MVLYESFEKRIERLQEYAKSHEQVTLYEVTALFGHDSYFLLSLFLIIPFLQPIPLLGLSTIIGTILAFFSALIIANQKLYIPDRLKNWNIKSKYVLKWTRYFLIFCKKTEKWLHPRTGFLNKSTVIRKLNGMLIFFLSLTLALPLPFPFTNTFPALSIAAISLGSLREDTITVSIGWFLFIITCLYLFYIILIPMKIVSLIT